MRTTTKLLVTVVGLSVALGAFGPGIARATWVSSNCYSNHYLDSIFRRTDAQAYASVANHEGYEWGGGCWNDNNVDDTPGAPNSGGEGPDCSGLVFKSWELRLTRGAPGGSWWDKRTDQHGPLTTWDFYSPLSTDVFYRLSSKSRSTTIYMDAFTSTTHIGMLSSRIAPSSNTDLIWEALGDAAGTGLFEQGYRYDSRYVGVRRKGWTADCYPSCQLPQIRLVVIR